MSEALNRNYQVCKEIGRGRFGVVSRCVSLISSDSFACKSIDKRLLSTDDLLESECLTKEPKLMGLVSDNVNVLHIFDVFEDETHLHMILELCNFPNLFDRIKKHTFTEPEAALVMVQLLQAVAHCHKYGVSHRDIKPEKILFDSRNRLKLGDFGSVELFRDGELMTGIVGMPYYVAPEVVFGREYGEKVDVWSCGVIFYIMLAGIPPFCGDSAPEIFEAVMRGNLRFSVRIFQSVSPAAKDLMRRMLCKDVSRRFSADQVLVEALELLGLIRVCCLVGYLLC